MKTILILAALIAGAWFGFQRWQTDETVVEEITDPVFAEIRVVKQIQGREIEMAMFGKMADAVDCRERAQRVWETVLAACEGCSMTVNDCRTELPQRYSRLFDNIPISSTYVAFTRGERSERDGRMVIWGVTADEGQVICESARTEFKKRYAGQVECVAARAN